MATVYLAHDLRHDRPVALKVLHPDLAHSLGPERFQREIKFLARLQHPHILTVHDSGEAAGQLWFTMPYIEGESLRQRLTREKQLPVDEAVQIAREAAQALEYAHQHGVIHRDIKPENLLLTQDGNTLVADFGIARTLTAGAERLTETGLAIGTPAYMSPEQASGEQDVGARSDIYSLGAVLYEMLSGEAPFTGATPQAVIAKRFTGEVPSVRRTRPTVTEALDHAIAHALALVPADRFATAAEFGRALAPGATQALPPVSPVPPVPPAPSRRRFPVAAAMLALGFAVGLGVLFAWRRGRGDDGPSGVRTLAVLPFENLGAPDQEYFADGVSDQVRGKLSGLAGMQVIARSSSTPYRKTAKPPRQIAEELGVRYLLTGTVRWERHPDGTSRVQVNPELVEITGGRPTTRWQQPFDAALTDVFAVQTTIAGQVAQALDVALADSARHELAERPTENLAAYDAYLRAEGVSSGVAADVATERRSAALYEQATALDPTFALAWARLGVMRSLIYNNSVPTPAAAAAARSAVERAMALAPERAESHYARAALLRFVERDPARALAEYQAALRLAPADPVVLSALAVLEVRMGHLDSALVHGRRAADLDPRSAYASDRLGDVFRALHRLPEAAITFDHALALAPADLSTRELRAMVALQQGDLAGARAVLRGAPREVDPNALVAYVATAWDLMWVLDDAQQQALLQLPPGAFDDDRGTWALVRAQTLWLRGDQPRARAYADTAAAAIGAQLQDAPNDAQLHTLRGLALAYAGSKAEAIREGDRGMALAGTNSAYLRHQLARIYVLSGEPEKALDQLEPLLQAHYDLTPGWLRIDPNFAALRGNPRFEKLARGQ